MSRRTWLYYDWYLKKKRVCLKKCISKWRNNLWIFYLQVFLKLVWFYNRCTVNKSNQQEAKPTGESKYNFLRWLVSIQNSFIRKSKTKIKIKSNFKKWKNWTRWTMEWFIYTIKYQRNPHYHLSNKIRHIFFYIDLFTACF